MTVVGQFSEFEAVSDAKPALIEAAQYRVDETYWGYIVRSEAAPSRFLAITQGASWLVGVSCLIAALGLWLMPSMSFGGGVVGMKFGATVLVLAVAAFCLWYASRGSDAEVQVDTRLGEVREVVRNRAGRATLLGRYGFDAIGSVFIDHGSDAPRDGMALGSLVLRYRNTSQTMHVATGPMSQLGPLRDRLGRDLMLAPAGPRRAPLPEPKFELTAA